MSKENQDVKPVRRSKKTAAAVTEDISHEVVSEQTQAPAPVTIQDRATLEIAKFSLPDARIAELKQAYGGLTIAANGLDAVKKARAEVRSLRTGLENKRKELKADYLETGRKIDAEAKRLTELLLEVETPLDEEIKKDEAEKERIRQEKEEKEQAILNQRINDLLANGMAFNGSYYAIGKIVAIDVVTLKNFKDEDFTRLLDRVKSENAAIVAERERLAAEEAAEAQRMKEEKEQQEAERARLEKERAQIESEKLQMIQEVRQHRSETLENYGIYFKSALNGWAFNEVTVSPAHLGTMPADEWQNILAAAKSYYQKQQEENERLEKERAAKNEQDNARRAVLLGMGLKYAQGVFFLDDEGTAVLKYTEAKVLSYDEKEFSEAVNFITKQIADVHAAIEKDKENKRLEAAKAAQEQEAARVAALSDAAKVKEYLGRFIAARSENVPTVTPGSFINTELGVFLKSIADAENRLENILAAAETK
jgi:colicin import membrane protein